MKRDSFVLLGDVVGSSRITDREAFQQRLVAACSSVNALFGKGLKADLKIIKGADEVGAVLTEITALYDILITLLDETAPELVRFSLVFDEIDTGLEHNDVSRMDGPAFHKAAALVEDLKRTGLLFAMETGNPLSDMAIEGQIALLLQVRRGWHKRYAAVVREYRLCRNQRGVAEILGMTQQGVSRILNAVSWSQTEILEGRLRKQLTAFPKGG